MVCCPTGHGLFPGGDRSVPQRGIRCHLLYISLVSLIVKGYMTPSDLPSSHSRSLPNIDLDPDTLRIQHPTHPTGEVRVELATLKRRNRGRFIPPVPEELFARAARLPRKALAVYLVLWQQAKLKQSDTVVLTNC